MDKLLSVQDLHVCYKSAPVLRGVSMDVRPGEILGVVGESGSGKSTTIYAALGILGNGGVISHGSIRYKDAELSAMPVETLRKLRGSRLALIAQNPMQSFHPMRKIKSQLHELVRCHGGISCLEAEERMLALLERMKLPDGKRLLDSYAFEMSGGMCQRASIAMAMVLQPELLFADEPTSALDVTVQAQVVEELMHIRGDFGTAIMIVSHNMGVIAHMADRIVVMYAGMVLEYGAPRTLIRTPAHPYTQNLIHAIPRLNAPAPRGVRSCAPDNGAQGCPYYAGCGKAQPECRWELPPLADMGNGHGVRCWLAS